MSRRKSTESSELRALDWRSAVGGRLRQERLRLGLTQVEFALRTGTSERTIAAYEAGGSTIRFEKLRNLAKAGVDVNYLVYGSPSEDPIPIDRRLWERVSEWAATSCVDERGRPLHELVRFQIMQRAYRNLIGVAADGNLEASLDRLFEMGVG